LIQNADDNSFDDNTPTISFALSRTRDALRLLMECNEVGFKEANIEALCRIGDSTKKARDRTKGYIGEKGIGFKSVFNVADVVHISSNNYSFRFDRKGVLGMITPIIESFPGTISDRGPKTRILLELHGEPEFQEINDELQKLEPQALLFLRKITTMVIVTPNRQAIIKKISEEMDSNGNGTVTLSLLYVLDNEYLPQDPQKYLIVRHTEEISLTPENRRADVEETEIVLAFPVGGNLRPLLRERQQTYAYLPIEDYGFNVSL
jgi:hypothetical protein